MIDLQAIRRSRREAKNVDLALETGKTKDGLTFRPMELTEEVRTRGGANSRRRKARVWRPRKLEDSDPS